MNCGGGVVVPISSCRCHDGGVGTWASSWAVLRGAPLQTSTCASSFEGSVRAGVMDLVVFYPKPYRSCRGDVVSSGRAVPTGEVWYRLLVHSAGWCYPKQLRPWQK